MGTPKSAFEKIGFRFAWQGIRAALKKERNLKIHLTAATLVGLTGFILEVSLLEWLFLLVAIMAVLVAAIFAVVIGLIIFAPKVAFRFF